MSCPNPFTLPTVDFVGGTTIPLRFHTFFEQDGDPFDLTDCTAVFSLLNYVNQDEDPVLSKVMTLTNGPEDSSGDIYPSIAEVVLDSQDTVGLHGKFIYQITFSDSDGRQEVCQGVLFVFRNIDPDALD